MFPESRTHAKQPDCSKVAMSNMMVISKAEDSPNRKRGVANFCYLGIYVYITRFKYTHCSTAKPDRSCYRARPYGCKHELELYISNLFDKGSSHTS